MTHHAGVSLSTVQRIWANNDLKPHLAKTFKLSNDPKFGIESLFAGRHRPGCLETGRLKNNGPEPSPSPRL
jgi:hypothetical protein